MVSSLLHFARGDVDALSFAAALAASLLLLRLRFRGLPQLLWIFISLQPLLWLPDSTKWVAAQLSFLPLPLTPTHVFTALIVVVLCSIASSLLFPSFKEPKYTVNDSLQGISFKHVKAGATLQNLDGVIQELRDGFNAGISKPLHTRRWLLQQLRRFFVENEKAIIEALKQDLGRPVFETLYYEVLMPISEIDKALKSLSEWASPKPVGFSILTWPSTQYLHEEPQGVVLVMACWNLPIMLSLVPIIGAIAAGNVVALKPTKASPAVAKLLKDVLPKYMDPRFLTVLGPFDECNDIECTKAILANRFDHVFFTGSVRGGRAVMELAAKHLSICTMELGGKNPVFLDSHCDVSLAAKRIVWGRMINAGQQCIAPDYVLCDARVVDEFCKQAAHWVKTFFGEDAKASKDFARINPINIDRLARLAQQHGGTVVVGGDADKSALYVSPTVVRCGFDAEIMKEETFGPILAVVAVKSLEEGLKFVNAHEKPLSLYIFSDRPSFIEKVILNTSSGGVTVNGTLLHAGHSEMPFGGVGHSGFGAYHGKYTFDCFSHKKPVVVKATWKDFGLLTDPFFLYAPWTGLKMKILRVVGKLL